MEETDLVGPEYPEHKEDPDSAGIVQYVVAKCGGAEAKIRKVIDGLTAYVEQRVS